MIGYGFAEIEAIDTLVAERRPELVDKLIPDGNYFNTIQTAILTAARGLSESNDDLSDVRHVHSVRHLPMVGLWNPERRQKRSPGLP